MVPGTWFGATEMWQVLPNINKVKQYETVSFKFSLFIMPWKTWSHGVSIMIFLMGHILPGVCLLWTN